jgi:hypothetical protein
VTFHEGFWVTVGAGAPVIALAAVVAALEGYKVSDSFDPPDDPAEQEAWPADLARRGRRIGYWLVCVFTLALTVQVLLLILALGSLAYGNNGLPPGVVIAVMPLSIVLVFLVGALTWLAAGVERRLKKKLRAESMVRVVAQPSPTPSRQAGNRSPRAGAPARNEDGPA